MRYRGHRAHDVSGIHRCVDVHREHVDISQGTLAGEAHPAFRQAKDPRLELAKRADETWTHPPGLLGRNRHVESEHMKGGKRTEQGELIGNSQFRENLRLGGGILPLRMDDPGRASQ